MENLKINPSAFREYDIRGIIGEDLSPEFAYALGLSYAHLLKSKVRPKDGNGLKVSIGWDCRHSGEEYSLALIKGISECGIDVISLGVCPTPLTYFSIHHLKLDGAIMVTGSHNPPEYNGFKVCVGKDTLHGAEIQEIKKIMEQNPAPGDRAGSITSFPIIDSYLEYIKSIARPLKKLKIVLDAGNGTAGLVAPKLFGDLGIEVVCLFCDPDGSFPNHHPDPTVLKNLTHLINKVKETKADLGVAYDGDSDRIGAVNENGGVIFGDELMIIFSRDILKEKKGATIISEVKSSHRLYQDVEKRGGVPLMWKTGHSLIKAKMKETGAALAGEMSGHMFFADRYLGYDDAIYATLRLLEILSNFKGPLSTVISDLPKTVCTPEIRIECAENLKFALIQKTIALLSKQLAPSQINTIDGIRVDFGNGWGLIRASNTSPVIVLRFEATSIALLEKNKLVLHAALLQAAKELDHPPLKLE